MNKLNIKKTTMKLNINKFMKNTIQLIINTIFTTLATLKIRIRLSYSLLFIWYIYLIIIIWCSDSLFLNIFDMINNLSDGFLEGLNEISDISDEADKEIAQHSFIYSFSIFSFITKLFSNKSKNINNRDFRIDDKGKGIYSDIREETFYCKGLSPVDEESKKECYDTIRKFAINRGEIEDMSKEQWRKYAPEIKDIRNLMNSGENESIAYPKFKEVLMRWINKDKPLPSLPFDINKPLPSRPPLSTIFEQKTNSSGSLYSYITEDHLIEIDPSRYKDIYWSLLFPFTSVLSVKYILILKSIFLKLIIGITIRVITVLIIYLIAVKFNVIIFNDSSFPITDIIDMTIEEYNNWFYDLPTYEQSQRIYLDPWLPENQLLYINKPLPDLPGTSSILNRLKKVIYKIWK